MATSTHLYIIRHGESVEQAKKIVGDRGLSALGVKQVERLRDRLAATGEIRADVLISSTMKRARETAEILAPALDLPIVFDRELEEWRDGDAEHLSQEEHRALFRAVPFEDKPYAHIVPNAESWVEFMLRVGVALHRIISEHAGKTIVLACHGGIVDASFFVFLGLSTLHFPRTYFRTHNASITHWLRTRFGDFPFTWALETYNDIMHLRDLDAPVVIPWQGLRVRPITGQDEPSPSQVADQK